MQVCNRVTGLLSPDPDTHKLSGALIYGTGRSDSLEDVRNRDSNWVGVENNAGFAGGLTSWGSGGASSGSRVAAVGWLGNRVEVWCCNTGLASSWQ
jgi:hypothetical protein